MKKLKLHWWILIAMLLGAVLGSGLYYSYIAEARQEVLGGDFSREDLVQNAKKIDDALVKILEGHPVYQCFEGISTIFLKLLKMIVIPLVFFSLSSGMVGLGDLSRLGRIGLKTFFLYILTSLLAILTGLTLVNIIAPGKGVHLPEPEDFVPMERPGSFWDVLSNMVPDNVVSAAASFDLIGVIFFTLLFGIFLLVVEAEKRNVMVSFIEGGAAVMMRMTRFIISLAPIGIAALVARMVSTTGPHVFLDLIWYVVTVLLGLSIHLAVTLPILIYLFTGRNPALYLRAMSSAILTGFSTASSSGTLAVTMQRAEEGAGVSNRVASFVLPLGATINMDGTALYEIVSVLFVAQIHQAVDPNFTLTFGQQLLIVFLGLMVSIGAAGIPHAGLVMMAIILEAVGLPLYYTALIWTIDRPLDMCRTAVNIGSDSSIALIVAHTEREVDESVLFKRGGG